jgi:hypothetical protein
MGEAGLRDNPRVSDTPEEGEETMTHSGITYHRYTWKLMC